MPSWLRLPPVRPVRKGCAATGSEHAYYADRLSVRIAVPAGEGGYPSADDPATRAARHGLCPLNAEGDLRPTVIAAL